MVANLTNHRRIGVRALRNHLSEILSEVRDDAVTYDVTLHGEVVAQLRPDRVGQLIGRSGPRTDEQIKADREKWAEYRRLAHLPPRPVDPEEVRRREERLACLTRQLSGGWPKGFSAVDVIREDRDAE